MASANTQMPIFSRMIDGRRQDAAGWLVQIAEIVLGYLSLTTPGLGLARAPVIQWSKLTEDNAMTLATITWAFTEGLIDERTALMLAPIDVTDIDTVLDLARKERAERMTEVAALLPQDLNDTNFEQGDESGSTEDTQAA
jgi:hypothetical protein